MINIVYKLLDLEISSEMGHTTALPWDIWPKKSGSQIFGGQFEDFILSTARDDENK